MSAVSTTQTETTIARLLDERDIFTQRTESLLQAIENREDKTPTETDREQLELYREKTHAIDESVSQLSTDLENTRKALETSRALRRAMAGADDGVEEDGDGIVYRDFATFARDYIITRTGAECSKIAQHAGGTEAVLRAKERLELAKRTPANTLSSNVGGLMPPQHIDQIFQVINNSRPIVASAQRTTLERGTLTYPSVDTKPVVAVQSSEKTEAGNTGMAVSMKTTTASTYLGGGDLSWQAINWSTPDALQLWFNLAAADYALKTEQDAAQALQHSGFSFNISSTLSSSADFPTSLAGIAAGAGDVYANSGRTADTIYMAPDQLYRLAALASTSTASFINAGNLSLSAQGGTLAGLNVVVSRGMDSGVVVVGDSAGLLVAETAGAPVELRVVEPAIGGVEVGIIGAFEAVVVDPGAFAMITTAS